jgi:hypothetical protein
MSSGFADLVCGHLRRSRGQRQKSEEVPAAGRIRSEAALEPSERVFILEQGDDDAFGRWVLTLS